MERTTGHADAPLADLLFGFMHRMGAHFEAVAAELDLTPSVAMALRRLDEGVPMRHLADELRCDRSHVTGLVDRLEDRGFVERRVDPDDRRVKQLVLTDEGRRARADLDRRLSAIPGRDHLSAHEAASFRSALSKIAHADG